MKSGFAKRGIAVTQYIFFGFGTTGFYEGMLWKKGKDNAQFFKRKFVLSQREFTLSYYNKENVSSQKLDELHMGRAFCIWSRHVKYKIQDE